MNDEKQMILEMLKEGKITVEEANSLLESLGGKKSRPENDFISKFSQSMENVIKKTAETFENISNIDLDSIDINQYNIRGKVNTHKEMRIEDEINNISIEIPNGKLSIERSNDSAITVNQDIWAKKSDLIDYLDIDIDGDKLVIRTNEKYENNNASAVLNLALGKNLYESLKVDLVNGEIQIEDVDFTNVELDSVNSKVNIINLSGDIHVNNVNGKIDIKNTNGNLNVENVNGSIYLSNITGQSANAETISGNIRVDGLDSKSFKADTNSGNIRIYNIKDSKEINMSSGFGNIVIDSENYQKDIKAYVVSQGLNLGDKFRNKIQKDKGYEVSTNAENADLDISAKAGFGKISIR